MTPVLIPSRLTVTVTQARIDAGEPGVCANCPIALAFWAALPDASNIEVSGVSPDDGSPAFAEIWLEGARLYYRLPSEAGLFIEEFDNDIDSVEPFTFEAELVAA
jgi:hypothetical protein